MSLTESGQQLKIGQRAPDFSLTGVDDKIYSLDDFSDANAIVFVFMCNHCPYVLAKLPILIQLHKTYSPKGVKFAGINSNNHPEYPQDDFDHMKEFAKKNQFKFPYLFDDSQNVAKAYGATCTPDPFVFDSAQLLSYHGRFDDATSPEKQPTTHELADALDAILEGRVPKSKFLPSMGCSIKWKQ